MAETIEGPEELEWEEWDPNSGVSFATHMVAGSFAGLAEHLCMFPVDTLRTNIQCDKCGSVTPFQTVACARKMVQRDGLLRLWRGVNATFTGCIPAHAAYFSVFEFMRSAMRIDEPGHHPAKAALCGAAASAAHDTFMTPFDLVKQRMQLGYYQSVSHCVRSVYKMEGISAFYRSFPVTLGMNIPYGCVMVAANEGCKKVLNPSGKYSFTATVISGCAAGGIAGLLTTPLDVIKTRLQTQELEPFQKVGTMVNNTTATTTTAAQSPMISITRVVGGGSSGAPHAASLYTSTASSSAVPLCESDPFPKMVSPSISAPRYTGIWQTARTIFAEEGLKGFIRGAAPRVLVHAPSVAISWTTYETLKHLIGGGALGSSNS